MEVGSRGSHPVFYVSVRVRRRLQRGEITLE